MDILGEEGNPSVLPELEAVSVRRPASTALAERSSWSTESPRVPTPLGPHCPEHLPRVIFFSPL